MPPARIVWVDEGNDDNPAQLKPLGAVPCFSIRDPRVTKPYLEARRASYGAPPGVYAAWNWYGNLGGAAFATAVSRELERIAPDTPHTFPFVCLDIETHDVAYVLAALKQWRKHRAKRDTDWTLEGMQGGLFGPPAIQAIGDSSVRVCPQAYTGSMQAMDAVEVALDLTAGPWTVLPRDRIALMYDAAQLPAAWQGYAFTQGRLP